MAAKQSRRQSGKPEAFHHQGLERTPDKPGSYIVRRRHLRASRMIPSARMAFFGSQLGTCAIAPRDTDSVALSGSGFCCFTFQPHRLIYCRIRQRINACAPHQLRRLPDSP